MKKIILPAIFALVSTQSFTQCTEVFFSEYIEGSSSNKVLEIYNPTSSPINLTGYTIKTYFNGSLAVGASLALTGTVAANDVYVVANSLASPVILAVADQVTPAGAMNFNGDDAIELVNGTTVVDVIGTVGVDPGTGWTVSGVTDAGKDYTIRRLQSAQMGNLIWAGSGENEWTVYSIDIFCYLNAHAMNTCGSTLTASLVPMADTFCVGVPIGFSMTSSGGTGATTGAWEYGDCSMPAIGMSSTYAYTTAGSYNVTYLVQDMSGAIYSSTFPITIIPTPSATITSAGPFCSSDSPTNLSAATTGGTWSGTGITSASAGTFNPSVAGAGTFAIIYTLSGVCPDDDTTMINVMNSVSPNILSGDSVMCNDSFGIFLYADSGGVWSGTFVSDMGAGNGFFSSGAIPPGIYYAVYTMSATCGSADSVMIDVNQYPTPSFNSSTTLATVTFTNTTVGTGLTYSWDFGDGNFSTVTNPVHPYMANGTYTVCLTADNGICSYSTCSNVTITGLSVNEIVKDVASVYPNPTIGVINISANANISKILVQDVSGKVVYTTNVNSTNAVLDLNSIANGIYSVMIVTSAGTALKKLEVSK